MRKFLLTYLIAGIGLAACADHNASLAALDSGPQAPINDPDDGVFQPGTGTSGGATDTGDAGSDTGGALGNDLTDDPTGGTAAGGSTGAAQEGGGSGAAQEGGSGAGQEGGSTNPPTDGGPGGQPVPEPGTLLLVGSGLAGAALLRRRRKQPVSG